MGVSDTDMGGLAMTIADEPFAQTGFIAFGDVS